MKSSWEYVYVAWLVCVDLSLTLRFQCTNQYTECTYWAVSGECDTNPSMKSICAPSCYSCWDLSFEARCPYDPDEPIVWETGALDAFYERVLADENYQKLYSPTIHSSPDGRNNSPVGPWIVTLENFLTDEECDSLIRWGYDLGFEPSADTGEKNFDGSYGSVFSSHRTSKNTWCRFGCLEDPLTVAVQERIANFTGIPILNSEHLQLLRYEETQRYHRHHDYIGYLRERKEGPRIMTFVRVSVAQRW